MDHIKVEFAGIAATLEQPILFTYLANAALKLHSEKMVALVMVDIIGAVARGQEIERMAEAVINEAEAAFDTIDDIEKEMPDHTYDFLKRNVYKYTKSILEPIFNKQ